MAPKRFNLFSLITKTIFGVLLSAGSFSLSAENIKSKDWTWNIDGSEYFYAATVNNSGHLFGQYCYFDSQSCVYIMGVDINCERESEMPALVNSDQGAMSLSLVCGHLFNNQNVLYVTPFDDIDMIVKKGSYFRIAIPMENDQFKVIRFSLIGSTNAINLMNMAAEKIIDSQDRRKAASDEEYL